MVAEVVQHFAAKLVDIHNYTPANSSKQKLENWATLNRESGWKRRRCAMSAEGDELAWCQCACLGGGG
jgi:hypothetical protein